MNRIFKKSKPTGESVDNSPQSGVSSPDELSRLKSENETQQDQLQRALAELREFQQKYPNSKVRLDKTKNENLPHWENAPEITKPLFEQYDSRIEEMSSTITRQANEIDGLRQHMEHLLNENEELRSQQLEYLQKSDLDRDSMPVGGLKTENKMLLDQLQRALKELKAYQLKYPSPYATKMEDENEDNLPVWHGVPEITTPLFEAYDARINELEDLVKRQINKIDGLKDHMETLVQENEELRSQQLEKLRKSATERNSLPTASNGPIGLDPSAPLNLELIAELNERVDILMDENALLVQQKVLLSAELDKQQSELTKKTQELNSQTQKLMNLQKEIQVLSTRALQAEKDRDEAANQALQCSDALGKGEIEIDTLNDQLAAMRQNAKEAEARIQELTKELKFVSSKTEGDGLSAYRRVKIAEDRVRELHSMLLSKMQDLEVANEMLRKLRSEYHSTRQDAEGMLQVMSGLERQLNEYVSREAEIEKLARESKEKIEESYTVRDQCAAREEQYRREIERLLQERKAALLNRKEEMEQAIDRSNRSLQEQTDSFDREMAELAERNAKLIFEAEKAGREARSAKEQLQKLQQMFEEERKAVQSALYELTDKLKSLSIGKEQETSKRLETQEANRDLKHSIEKYQAQLDRLKAESVQVQREREAEVVQWKSSLRDAQKELSERQRLLNRKTKEADDLRASVNAQIMALEQKYHDESALYQRRAAEAERFSRELEASGSAGDLRSQTMVDQLKEKYVSAVAQLESKLRHELDQMRSVTAKNRSLESTVEDLIEEKSTLTRVVEDSKSQLRQHEEELQSCRSTITELTHQLSASHQAREESAMRAARTIEELSSGVNVAISGEEVLSPMGLYLNSPGRAGTSPYGKSSPYAAGSKTTMPDFGNELKAAMKNDFSDEQNPFEIEESGESHASLT